MTGVQTCALPISVHARHLDVEDFGDLVEREVEVVVEDDHRVVVEGEMMEGSFELIAIDDRLEFALCRRVDIRKHADDGPATAFTTALGVAGAHEEPVRPGVKARRVAELGKVPPDRQQRLLRRILGEVGRASCRERVCLVV